MRLPRSSAGYLLSLLTVSVAFLSLGNAVGNSPVIVTSPNPAGESVLSPSPQVVRYLNGTLCAVCHPDIFEEWRYSEHSTAYQGRPLLQAIPACLVCHAPQIEYSTPENSLTDVQCVACHGGDHARRPLEEVKRGELCGNCHTGPEGGPTYETWNISAHKEADMSCATCHNPHSLELIGRTDRALCGKCHAASGVVSEGSAHARYGIGCSVCHMYGKAWYEGEWRAIVSHTWKIGTKLNITEPASAWELETSEACSRRGCHSEETVPLITVELVRERTLEILTSAESEIEEGIVVIAGVNETVTEARNQGVDVKNAGAKVADALTKIMNATRLITLVVDDRSGGFHNREKARKMGSDAIFLAEEAQTLAIQAESLAELGMKEAEVETLKNRVSVLEAQVNMLIGGVIATLVVGVIAHGVVRVIVGMVRRR